MIVLAALFFAPPARAQETVDGTFYPDCWIADGAATTIALGNHVRMNLFEPAVKADDVYRTQEQTFEGEDQTMQISLCDPKTNNCRDIEGVLSTYLADADTIEGTLEYFDGTELQGDAESVQGRTLTFRALLDETRPAPHCL